MHITACGNSAGSKEATAPEGTVGDGFQDEATFEEVIFFGSEILPVNTEKNHNHLNDGIDAYTYQITLKTGKNYIFSTDQGAAVAIVIYDDVDQYVTEAEYDDGAMSLEWTPDNDGNYLVVVVGVGQYTFSFKDDNDKLEANNINNDDFIVITNLPFNQKGSAKPRDLYTLSAQEGDIFFIEITKLTNNDDPIFVTVYGEIIPIASGTNDNILQVIIPESGDYDIVVDNKNKEEYTISLYH
ncbi:MAG: hypothetical protein KTR20_06500 [Cellvibrionaceae bacterium]|nr:hypothetical protein [Cellvibrionaceae bacterium]